MKIKPEPMFPKIYINAFPKSGTHLAYLLASKLTQPQEPKHQLGTFLDNCWTNRWSNIPMVCHILRGQPEGTWIMGHMGYRDEFRDALEDSGTCMIFVYRDLRDVAVSQTYHIESDDEIFRHPDKELFMALPSHEIRLRAVIEGYDKYPGIIERWEFFASWLDVDWVCSVRFEDIRTDPHSVVEKVIPYIIKRTAKKGGFEPVVIKENYDSIIDKTTEMMKTTRYSSTYRTGNIGNWKEEFTPEIEAAFEASGGNEWIRKLNYEETVLCTML